MDKYRKYLKILLPSLFIAYLGCLIALTHVHIINGVTIVHSHPYQKTDDGRPDHSHNYAEFQLLHQLSTLQITGALFAAILLAALYSHIRTLSHSPVYPDYLIPFNGKCSLRAPPLS
ncbi:MULTISPECIES: hypothetical protein [Parabacteroides]|uniref:hypothetical protein n=1 Tax=Parabacteroides provencensis TaxID=1944636 RepID=UPI000C15B870|nr:hypothetical protein [Parabacteroides provencensis]